MVGEHQAEQAVVGGHEAVRVRFHRQRAAGRAHAGIHHGQEHGAGGKAVDGGGQREAARGHVVRRQLVHQVHELRVRAHREHGALHGPDIVVVDAEVGQQRDDGPHLREL